MKKKLKALKELRQDQLNTVGYTGIYACGVCVITLAMKVADAETRIPRFRRGNCQIAIFLLLIFTISFIPATTASAWDADEVYEHNRRVRASWVEREMCDDLREFFLLPVLRSSSYVSRYGIIGELILDEFPAEIVHKAQEIIEGIYCDYEKARVISFWVGRNVSAWFQGGEFTSALAVLQNRRALCIGFTNLTVALLRSVSIPAKYVSGTGHAWVEAFVNDRWIIVDPSPMYGIHNRYHERFFDMSLREISRYLRYADTYMPMLINGLMIDEETGSVLINVGDKSAVAEIIIPEGLATLDDTLRLQRSGIPDENRHIRPFPNLERLVLPEGFVNLNTAVFSQSDLSEVVLPESLDRIGPNAFEETNLTDMAFPNNLRFIGERAFAKTDLDVALFPDSLETIRAGAFDNAGLYAAYIPSSTTDINISAFDNNPYLVIYGYAGSAAEGFAFHYGFPFVAVDAAVSFADGFVYDGDRLVGTYGLGDVLELSVPDDFSYIGDYAFRNALSLSAVFIPPSVEYVANNAFYGVSELVVYGLLDTAANAFAESAGFVFVPATALGEPMPVAAAPDEVVSDEIASAQAEETGSSALVIVIIGISIILLLGVILTIVVLKKRKPN